MVLEISQETFNNAVKENVEILGLTEEEAIKEAIKQFESQGVNLGKIIKDSVTNQEYVDISSSIQTLVQLQKSKGSIANINDTLEKLKSECDKGLPQKVAAGKAGAYFVLLNIYDTFNDKAVKILTLKALIALMTKQPDLLDDRGVEFIVNNLKNQSQELEVQKLILKWMKECCIMHEKNRQNIFDANIIDIIKSNLKENTAVEILRETLSVCRALVQDDDVRVEFSRSHEHARIIASDTLCSIMNLLYKFRGEEQLNLDIILTLTALMVRTEFCKKVEDADGLNLLKGVMETFPNSDKIIRHSFKLIKALAGNDDCKAHMISMGFVEVMKNCVISTLDSVETVTAGLTAIAALTLRSPENSKAFFEGGIAEIIVTAMRQHSDQKYIQKSGSWAIRNMVSRSKYQTSKFIELGVEDVLQADLKKFKDIEYDIKAALRDLGCKVNLKEEWIGKGGALTTGLTKRDNEV